MHKLLKYDKKLTIFSSSFFSAICSFAISPHGSRLDYGHSSHNGGGVFIVIFIVVAIVFLLANSKSSSSKNSKSNVYNNSEYYYLEERIKKAELERKDFEKGCLWLICIIAVFLIGIIINSLKK